MITFLLHSCLTIVSLKLCMRLVSLSRPPLGDGSLAVEVPRRPARQVGGVSKGAPAADEADGVEGEHPAKGIPEPDGDKGQEEEVDGRLGGVPGDDAEQGIDAAARAETAPGHDAAPRPGNLDGELGQGTPAEGAAVKGAELVATEQRQHGRAKGVEGEHVEAEVPDLAVGEAGQEEGGRPAVGDDRVDHGVPPHETQDAATAGGYVQEGKHAAVDGDDGRHELERGIGIAPAVRIRVEPVSETERAACEEDCKCDRPNKIGPRKGRPTVVVGDWLHRSCIVSDKSLVTSHGVFTKGISDRCRCAARTERAARYGQHLGHG